MTEIGFKLSSTSFNVFRDWRDSRTSVVKNGAAFSALQGATDNYGYNERSEVISARRTKGHEEIRGFSFDYAYDPIGNRKTSAIYDETGTKHETTYTANSLNQYTQRTVPGNAQVYGEVLTNATVAVNNNPTYRHGVYFYGGDYAHNSANAIFKSLAIEATSDNSYYAQTGSVFVAKSPEQFTYDADGNLTSDGRFHYTWNGENRLVRAEELYAPDTRSPYVVTYAYDHQGRMIRKDITTISGAAIKSISYLLDGYNIIRETTWGATQWGYPPTEGSREAGSTRGATLPASANKVVYNIWGLDLNGTLQGAGGVGGLLAVTDNNATYIPTYDANGNISEYINATDGTIAAHYDYSPFGEQILASGTLANTFTYRFSTKPFCTYTGLLEYQYRKYHPSLGRWLSRDPIEEEGGINVYAFCENSSIFKEDSLGLRIVFDENSTPQDMVENRKTRGYLSREPRGLNLECSFGGRLSVSGFATRKIFLKPIGDDAWNLRYKRYDLWGTPRTNKEERECALRHEMDHYKSYDTLFAFLHELDALDGKYLGFFCCEKKKTELYDKYAHLYSQALMKSVSYDSEGKDCGGVYPR